MGPIHDVAVHAGGIVSSLPETIAEAKGRVVATRDDLLTTFAHVPEERLDWSPSEHARSALWLVGHCGAANVAFATFLRGESFPMPDNLGEAMVAIRDGGRDVRTRAAAERSVRESCEEVLAALDTVSGERMGSMSQTPFGPMPYAMWIEASRTHMGDHARQLDYLQTIWGDLADHKREAL